MKIKKIKKIYGKIKGTLHEKDKVLSSQLQDIMKKSIQRVEQVTPDSNESINYDSDKLKTISKQVVVGTPLKHQEQ